MNLIKKYQATTLKTAAVFIAVPRYAGAFALSVGYYLDNGTHNIVGGAEIVAGIAMAILEGFAIAYILSKWRLLKSTSITWYALLIVVLLLALSLPLVAVPYLYFMQNVTNDVTTLYNVNNVFPNVYLQNSWNFIVAFVPMLVVIGVGLADVDRLEQEYKEVEFELKVAKKKAYLEQELSNLELATEQARVANELEKRKLRATNKIEVGRLEQTIEEQIEKPFLCPYCKEESYETERELRGHKGWCKKKLEDVE